VSVRGAAFLGIGSMVGAGIFALLGQAAVTAGSALWLSFLLAGFVTLLLAYNVVKLGIRNPSVPSRPGLDERAGAMIVPRWGWRMLGERIGAADDRLCALPPAHVGDGDEQWLVALSADE
jgi:hypothetical protein